MDGELIGYREEKGRLVKLLGAVVARQRVEDGMVFQLFYLFPRMSGLHNVTLGLIQVRGMSVREAEQVRAVGWGESG